MSRQWNTLQRALVGLSLMGATAINFRGEGYASGAAIEYYMLAEKVSFFTVYDTR